MGDKFPPLLIAPLKRKSLLETIWEAVGGYVLFGAGCVVGWLVRGMG